MSKEHSMIIFRARPGIQSWIGEVIKLARPVSFEDPYAQEILATFLGCDLEEVMEKCRRFKNQRPEFS
jgi:hypothetical protein